MVEDSLIRHAAAVIRDADALLICAGAGMGVDSGLPDFRGDRGFWQAYPPYAHLGLGFTDMANPRWFTTDPELAWGFYGHRLGLYRTTHPHAGFDVLLRWGGMMPHGTFVFTSNVDGQFQRAGFFEDQLLECHGSIHHLQCNAPCREHIWSAAGLEVAVDETTMRAGRPLPACPYCNGLARPNVLMFGDWNWLAGRMDGQQRHFRKWLERLGSARLAIVECGAGTAVPTVRMTAENLARAAGATLIRINVREPEVPRGHLGLAGGAADTLARLDALINPV